MAEALKKPGGGGGRDLGAEHLDGMTGASAPTQPDAADEARAKRGRPRGARDRSKRRRRAAPSPALPASPDDYAEAEAEIADQEAEQAAEEIADTLGALAAWFGGPDAAWEPVGPFSRQYAVRVWAPLCRKYHWTSLPPELGAAVWGFGFVTRALNTPTAKARLAKWKGRKQPEPMEAAAAIGPAGSEPPTTT